MPDQASAPESEGPPALLAVAEFAARLGVSSRRVYSLIEDGLLPGVVRVGRRAIRLDPARVERWIAEGGVDVEKPWPLRAVKERPA